MTASTNTAAAGDARGVPGRPAQPDRPRRFDDDARNDAYWARIIASVDSAPPFTNEQKAQIRAAFHSPTTKEAAA